MKVIAHPDGLLIKLEGLERLWALRRQLSIPKQVIASVQFLDEKPPQNFALPFIKLPGTVLPKILMAGQFVKPGERDFWYLRVQHEGMVSIRSKPGSFKYDRVLLSCDAETANDIVQWWKND